MSERIRLPIRVSLALMVSMVSVVYPALAQSETTFEEQVQKIFSRPEFAHSRFGMEFISADTGLPVYQLHPQELFVPGSTTKLLTTGIALKLLGEDYRFVTRIYRTGPISKDGTLQGDLVLVASGDPNLSNRVEPNDTLAFENVDHSYGGSDSHGLPGNPLRVIEELADQVVATGIRGIRGRVIVDTSLFPEGERELGTDVVISPIVINDNVVDVVARPGPSEGSLVQLQIAPVTGHLTILNRAQTGPPGTTASLKYEDEELNSDGTYSINLTGTLAIDAKPTLYSYPVPKPSRFAVSLVVESLKRRGIKVAAADSGGSLDFRALSVKYTQQNLVAEHLSPPFKEEAKVILKVSQNVHAGCIPFLLGAIIAHKTKDGIEQAGFDLENKVLTNAGLDLKGAAQSDGAGGKAYFTPDFLVQYLLYLSKQREYTDIYNALPILGIDGTLFNIQVSSVARGHVHAKTGTFGQYDALNHRIMVTGKALAGYIDTSRGQHLIFAIFINMVSVPNDTEAIQRIAGEAVGEISALAFDAPFASLSIHPDSIQ